MKKYIITEYPGLIRKYIVEGNSKEDAYNNFIEDNIDFMVATERYHDKPVWVSRNTYLIEPLYNPDVIMSIPNNLFLLKCIDWYIEKYTLKIPYGYWTYSIVICFRDIMDLKIGTKEGIFTSFGLKLQLLTTCCDNENDTYTYKKTYKGIDLIMNRDKFY